MTALILTLLDHVGGDTDRLAGVARDTVYGFRNGLTDP